MECKHPLEVVSEKSEDVSEGRDCWGFRPNVAPEDAADIVGIWLRGQQPDWDTVPRMGRQGDPRVRQTVRMGALEPQAPGDDTPGGVFSPREAAVTTPSPKPGSF